MPTSLRLLHESDVPDVGDGRTFRYSRARASLAAAFVLAMSAVLIVVGRLRHAPPAYFIAGVTLVILWVCRGMLRARFLPTNWLVRIGDEGLYVKFRSYLNHHMSTQDWTVFFVPFRAVRAARLVRETQDVPNVGERGTTRRRRVLVELDLREDAPDFAEALAAERGRKGPRVPRWYGSSSFRWRDYPVRMPSPGRLEIEWGVVPGAASLLAVLAARGVDAEVRDVSRDFTHLASLDREEQERRLRELAEQGQVMEASAIARKLYGWDLGRATQYVDALAAGRLTGERR